MPSPVSTPPQKVTPVRWAAFDPVGIGHAIPLTRGRYTGGTRAACGSPAQDERYEWPVKSRCPHCLIVRGEAA